MIFWRNEHKKSRIPVENAGMYYETNTSARKRRACVFCGETGPGWCTRYPRTKRSLDWERKHVETCKAHKPYVR